MPPKRKDTGSTSVDDTSSAVPTAQAPDKKARLEGVPRVIPDPVPHEFSINPEFLRLCVLKTVDDTLRAGFNEGTLFVANRTDKVVDVYRGLIQHNFTSVPVLQAKNSKYYGFIDLHDIVKYTVQHFGRTRLTSLDDFWHMINEEERFKEKSVNDLMMYPLSRRNPFFPVVSGYSLMFAIELMARERGLHRVPIVDRDRRLIGLITQSQLTRFLHTNIESLGDKRNKPVSRLQGVLHEVVSVNDKQEAIEAFTAMDVHNVSGVAVVDAEGRLVEAMSVRDLKVISNDAKVFYRLYQPIDRFLEYVRADHQTRFGRPRNVVSCNVNHTLGDVIGMLAEQSIHRVFVVDDQNKPIGVISLRDVLLELLSV